MLACTIVCINVARVAPDAMLLVYEDESLRCSFASMGRAAGGAGAAVLGRARAVHAGRSRRAVGGGAAGDRGERVGWHRPQSERWHYSEIKRREGATEKYQIPIGVMKGAQGQLDFTATRVCY